MTQEIKTPTSQFRLATLLSVIGCIIVFCASAIWVVQSDDLGKLTDIPTLIIPPIPMIGIGAFAVPIVCLAIVLLMLILVLRSTPRSFTAMIYFGFVAMAITLSFTMNSGFWDNSLRLLFATTLSSIVMLFETLWRKLPQSQAVAATLSIFVSFGYYVFLLSRVAIAVF